MFLQIELSSALESFLASFFLSTLRYSYSGSILFCLDLYSCYGLIVLDSFEIITITTWQLSVVVVSCHKMTVVDEIACDRWETVFCAQDQGARSGKILCYGTIIEISKVPSHPEIHHDIVLPTRSQCQLHSWLTHSCAHTITLSFLFTIKFTSIVNNL